MARGDVRQLAGEPSKRLDGCWIYPYTKKGNPAVDYIYFCFNQRGRVAQIKYGIHL